MKLTCIVCPLGCDIEIEEDNGNILTISGYNCPRGKLFAQTEFFNPQRMVTTIVSLDGADHLYLPVISDGEVPKKKLKHCIELLKTTRVQAPVTMGDIVLENILDTGINIIAAKTATLEK